MRESCSASLKLVADLLYLASQPKVTARAYGGKSGSYGFDHKSLRPQRRWHRADRFRATSTPLVLHATVQQFLAVFHQLRAYMLRPARTGAGSLLSRDRLSLKLDCAGVVDQSHPSDWPKAYRSSYFFVQRIPLRRFADASRSGHCRKREQATLPRLRHLYLSSVAPARLE